MSTLKNQTYREEEKKKGGGVINFVRNFITKDTFKTYYLPRKIKNLIRFKYSAVSQKVFQLR